jgi:hypothetical protein
VISSPTIVRIIAVMMRPFGSLTRFKREGEGRVSVWYRGVTLLRVEGKSGRAGRTMLTWENGMGFINIVA